MFGSIGSGDSARRLLADRARAVERLGAYCGRADVEACDRRTCCYFEEDQNRCALLVYNVYERLGDEALRWFATHKTAKVIEIEPIDAALAMRVATR
ncbi:MAG TPA: hypothetical protein VJ891_02250 [Casimicrobiaceae bacterium]|nr:hypothetical protein [Casimicrobiaceae bacterium]